MDISQYKPIVSYIDMGFREDYYYIYIDMQRVVYRLFNNNMFYPNKLASLEEYGR